MVSSGAIAGFIAGGATDADSSPELSTSSTELATGSFALASASTTAVPVVENPIVASARGSVAVDRITEASTPAAATSPAAAVAMRFPTTWNTFDSSTAPLARVAYGGSTAQGMPSGLVFAPTVAPPPSEADGATAAKALAYAHAGDESSRRVPDSGSDNRKENTEPPPNKRNTRPKPAATQPPTLFNDAQLTAIKARLKLTESQQQYWPAVEQALRAIEWRLSGQGKKAPRTRLAKIDPNSAEVQQLKSAAIPLIMSMHEEQKREVRLLAHTMGLSKVASQF